MFCTKCGRPHNSTEIICDECKMIFTNQLPTLEPTVAVAKRKDFSGLGRAICGTIFAVFGLIWAFLLTNMGELTTSDFDSLLGFTAALLFNALPSFIISLTFGVKSVTCYARAKEPKPIATFILGLFSLACATIMNLLAITSIIG